MTLEVYPVYEVSPDTTGYAPTTTPVTSPPSEVSLPPPALASLPPGAPVSLGGIVACDIHLLDRSAGMVPVLASDNHFASDNHYFHFDLMPVATGAACQCCFPLKRLVPGGAV